MASTSQLLTWIELQMHGWNREGPRGTRALLSEAHKMLLQTENDQNIIFDDTTGNLPYITTTSGVYRYNAASDVWRIKHILVDAQRETDYEFLADSDWNYEEITIAGLSYLRVLNIRTSDWRRTGVAWFQFMGVDPGDTTEYFRQLAFRRITDITSDTVQHQMPGTTDVEFLMPATIKLIEAINDHGKFNETREYIMGVLAPQISLDLQGGEQGINQFIAKRPF